jgi:hypothetical protein
MAKVVISICGACCCFWSAFGIVALFLSFKSLEQGKYGLTLGWSSQTIGEEVLDKPGLQMVGFGNMILEYPSTFQSIYFLESGSANSEGDIQRGPIRARSADGLEMRVSVSFQWKLQPNSLKPLYYILGGGDIEESFYRDEFVRFARAAVVHTCSLFTADLFFTNRTTITSDMYFRLEEAFDQPDKGLLLSIKGLQLREVSLPAAFDAEILRTQEQIQEVKVALAERNEKLIFMDQQLSVTGQEVLKVVEEAQGSAGAILELNTATVRQQLVLDEKTAIANAKILEAMDNSTGSSPYERLFDMMQIDAIDAHESKNLVLDV